VAELVREARHDTINAMRAELGLKETIWPPEDYNPFHGTDLKQKYADRRARLDIEVLEREPRYER